MRHLVPVVPFLLAIAAAPRAQEARWLDLAADAARQSVVHRTPGKYQGHPTTVLLPDGKTILCVHPEGHGKGPIVLQKSEDGGQTWGAPLPVPASWATSQETPTIHRLIDRDGTARLVVFSGLYPIRRAVSVDDGRTWSELEPIGAFGGIVAMASVIRLTNGDHAAFFHDDGRFFREGGKRSDFTVYQTRSADGGRTWAAPTVVWTGAEIELCEPGVIRSPDGKRLAMLLRENSRKQAAQVVFSDDEAATWSAPKALPPSLTGDRHVGAYGPDGRLLVSFRDMAPDSPARGDWVAWVGTFADLEQGRAGQYRVRLSRNWHGWDCGYPGVEVLPDGTFVLVTYGYWEPGQSPFVRAVRLRLAELDELAKRPAVTIVREPDSIVPVSRPGAAWEKRHAEQLAAARAGGAKAVFVGDSITQGWEMTGKQHWTEVWVPRGVRNAGISGDRTQHVLWRLDHGLLAAYAAPGNDVKAVVVMIGTNNSNGQDNTAEEIAKGVEAVVRRLRQGLPQATVVLLSIFPRGATPNAQREKNAQASRLAAAAFADDPKVLVRDYGPKFMTADGAITKEVMPDQLHLTAAAYQIWSDALLADLAPLLQ